MLKFQPPGFEQKSALTRLGRVAYYTPIRTLAKSSTDTSQPTVIFFHNFGGGASAYEWSKVYAVLTAGYRVVAPDLIGWGASDHPARRYTLQDYLHNIEDFIQRIATDPIIAVASSFTGGLVARLAADRPDLFQRLFLACPAGFRDLGKGAGRRLPEPLINFPFLDQIVYALGANNEIAVRNFLENFLFAKRDRLSPETVSAYLASAQQPNAEYAALSFLRGDLYFDLAPYLAQLTVPTAMIWGEQAQFTPVSLGRQLASLNPEAVQRFQVVSETGVLPHLEQPGTVTALLLDWLAADTSES
ncbi:alpha/beta hydrolase [Leptolyngbya sp. BC1307]|uniref:alpha/beta fold hydrolase n=1 Tax=Leptolyngbya sp. BC1307 TaxID=2029589 RepID=UPI000EFC9746|nr:alpha/beta hydrolase [Leptolyngbya sp. BC1307]